MKRALKTTLLLGGAMAMMMGLGACKGEDGGAFPFLPSPGGTTPTPVVTAADPANVLESCTVCHGEGAVFDPAEYHVRTTNVDFELLSQPVVEVSDVVIKFSLTLNGNTATSYAGINRAVISEYDSVSGAFTRHAFDRQTADYTVALVHDGAGEYTARISKLAVPADATKIDPTTLVGGDVRYYLRVTGSGLPNASVSFGADEFTRPTLASNQGCINCHGESGGDGLFGHHTMPWKVETCTTCHSPDNRIGYGDYRSSLATLVHGVHAGYAMTGEAFDYKTYSWKTTYPTYMNNCSVCHDTTAGLAVANDAPVSWNLCMSCHQGWDGFSNSSATFLNIHNNDTLPAGSSCVGCHTSFKSTVAAMHNSSRTARGGLIWDGQDMSVVEGAKVDMQITGVSYEGSNLKVTWTAEYDGAAVNPCNDTVAANAPIFIGATASAATGQSASNLNLLRAYGQGDDWVNAGLATNPGQAPGTNVTPANTVCAENVATTTIPLTAEEQATSATKGVVALQGRAQVALGFDFDSNTTGTQNVIQVRSKTPTYEYVIGTGAAATARRAIVDSEKCLGCHVGSLYQHGGNRIDNVDLCVMCHNEASNEKNVRVNDGVDASEAYDGKVGQTYGFKSLLHAVHSSNSSINSGLTMIYRSFGIYVWGSEDSVIPNWPGTGSQTVYGSNPSGTNPDGTTRSHYFHVPTYPRNLKECTACHTASYGVPDQAISVATTVDAGAAPWGNQLDDKLISTSTAACTSCHQSAGTKGHAYQNSFAPTTLSNGRQTILDGAK